MDKKWYIVIIVILVLMLLNANKVPFGFHYYKQTQIGSPKYVSNNDELQTLRTNFKINIENSNIKLEELSIKDNINNLLNLNDVFKDGRENILVCRFSKMQCESCINFAIQTILNQINTVGKDNVLFLGTHRNSRIFNQEIGHYNLQNMNVCNIETLDIPVERLNFPYYFILNSDMVISNVFVPDKAAPSVTMNYLETIHKRYFSK